MNDLNLHASVNALRDTAARLAKRLEALSRKPEVDAHYLNTFIISKLEDLQNDAAKVRFATIDSLPDESFFKGERDSYTDVWSKYMELTTDEKHAI